MLYQAHDVVAEPDEKDDIHKKVEKRKPYPSRISSLSRGWRGSWHDGALRRFIHAFLRLLNRKNVCAYVLTLVVGLAEDAVIGVEGKGRHGALEIDFRVPIEVGKGVYNLVQVVEGAVSPTYPIDIDPNKAVLILIDPVLFLSKCILFVILMYLIYHLCNTFQKQA